MGFTLFLVEGEESEFARFPTWKTEVVDQLPTLGAAIDEDEGGKGGAKRKGAAGAGPAKKARK